MAAITTMHSGARSHQAQGATCLGRIRRDERGFSLVMTCFGFMALFGASMLAIDVGMLMMARTQAQAAADAGALAGATALVFNSYDDRTAAGPAVSSAVNTARANLVAGVVPSVLTSDVAFPVNPVSGESDQVQVTVYRTAARSNPVSTLIARYFGMRTADIVATATAVAAAANAETCVLPFTIPDKWIEKQCATANCTWTPEDTFDLFASQGNRQNVGAPLPNPDIYIAPGSRDATGYQPERDKGLRLVLKNNNDNKVAPSMYNAWDLPGSVGGEDYRNNIAGCNSNLVRIGDTMSPENGNMVGPTSQGATDLIGSDPNAHWNPVCNCVRGSAYRTSPRIRALPLYHPVKYTEGQHTGKSQPQLEVVNYLGFFIEEVNGGGEVIGRITPITDRFSPGGPSAIGGFAQAIMLVR